MDLIARLITQACKHPAGSRQRNQALTKLIKEIVHSKKLWRDNTPGYEDALQQTWIYMCRNLCEATTGRVYDAKISRVETWLNSYLKRRLQDLQIERIEYLNNQVSPFTFANGESFDVFDAIPDQPEIPPILEETRRWAEADATDELKTIHIRGRPEINCQVLILRRLPPETDWKTLAQEWDCSLSTISNFYQRQCVPRLRKFGEIEGYI